MRPVRIYPSATHPAIYRQLAAIDRALGYPRTHVDGEPGYHRAIGSPPAYTETHTLPLVHPDGRAAIEIDDTIRALAGRAETVGGVRVVIDASTTHADLDDRETWTHGPPRGGF